MLLGFGSEAFHLYRKLVTVGEIEKRTNKQKSKKHKLHMVGEVDVVMEQTFSDPKVI